jgi:hypothetical protein
VDKRKNEPGTPLHHILFSLNNVTLCGSLQFYHQDRSPKSEWMICFRKWNLFRQVGVIRSSI